MTSEIRSFWRQNDSKTRNKGRDEAPSPPLGYVGSGIPNEIAQERSDLLNHSSVT